MTLVTAVASAEWLAMAADRRLTWDNDPQRTRDIDSKVAILRDGPMIGYAGDVSWLPDATRVERWLLERTRGVHSKNQIAEIRSGLQAEWASRTLGAFAVLGVGYRIVSGGRLEPYIVSVSNAMNEHMAFNPHQLQKRFQIRTSGISAGQLGAATIGFTPDQFDEDELGASLSKVRTLSQEGVAKIRSTLIDFHLATADKANGVVGTQTLVVIIGRGAWPVRVVRTELGHDSSNTYVDQAVSYTYNDPEAAALGYVPAFAPAIATDMGELSGIETRVGSKGPIGPQQNLREIAWD